VYSTKKKRKLLIKREKRQKRTGGETKQKTNGRRYRKRRVKTPTGGYQIRSSSNSVTEKTLNKGETRKTEPGGKTISYLGWGEICRGEKRGQKKNRRILEGKPPKGDQPGKKPMGQKKKGYQGNKS